MQAALLVVDQVELRSGQLATDDDARPVTDHPTGIDVLGLRLDRVMHRRVIDEDERAVDLDCARNEDGVAQKSCESLRDRRLAGTGRTVEENRALTHHRRADLVDETIIDNEIVKRTPHCFRVTTGRRICAATTRR